MNEGSREILHVVFTPSGAATLRQVLKTLGRSDSVIAAFDDLSFGPIDPMDLPLRQAWIESELGWTDYDIAAETNKFQREAFAPDRRKIAWFSRRSAKEYAGFLAWLWQMEDVPCEVIDLTHAVVSRPTETELPAPGRHLTSLAILPPDKIVSGGFLDSAQALHASDRSHHRAMWSRLRHENAPLRVIEDLNLVSAPMSFFDSLLMSFVNDSWQKVAIVVGHALASHIFDNIYQTGDLFLASRVQALVESRQLEMRGQTALAMRYSEVRRRQIR